MHLLCLGLSHHTAPVDVRERFAISEIELGPTARALAQSAGLAEAVVVSTCNRVEFYTAARDAPRGLTTLREFVERRAGTLGHDAFVHLTHAAGVRHLFRVVCGLDSMILGETEILGQVKLAYRAAQESSATGKYLNKLFQRAFNVAKEVRTNTNITRGAVSVGSVAVDLAEKIFGRLAPCTVMILGAGETSELTARALKSRGVKTIFVANRSYDRAVVLAREMGGAAVHFDAWQHNFREVDILIGSTSAPHHILHATQLAPIMRTRPDRPLFCIDLAVPRDIEPAVNDLDGVYLYDIDSLQAIADESMNIRRQELAACEQIIERHVAAFIEWFDQSSGKVAATYPGAMTDSAPVPSKS